MFHRLYSYDILPVFSPDIIKKKALKKLSKLPVWVQKIFTREFWQRPMSEDSSGLQVIKVTDPLYQEA